MSVLIIAEHDNSTLAPATLSTIQAATLLERAASVLVIGTECQVVADEVASFQGVNEVIVVDNPTYEHCLAENTAKVVAEMATSFSYVLAPSNTFGKNLLPRVAGLLGVGQISDVIEILRPTTFLRPIYAGNALALVEALDPIKVMTIRSTAFQPVTKASQKAEIKKEEIVIENRQSKFISRQLTKSDRPDLTTAKIVISGGRGLQNSDNFKLLEQLAKQLGAAIGASRAAVDAGFVPNDYQVGQTGKVIAPDLYIAVGISGAIQHIAGMKDSKVVVAINKDPDAPIFSVADYGLVGDLFKILPELQEELIKLGYTTQ